MSYGLTKTICTYLSLHSVLLYQLQPHSQHEYTIVVNNSRVMQKPYRKYGKFDRGPRLEAQLLH